jgi:hypothetical protein
LTLTCFVLIASTLLASQTAAGQQSASEWVHIDGRKNPELIPQWNIWRTAFRRIADGPVASDKGRRLIPLPLQEVFSEKEALLLLKEGDAEYQRFNDCARQVDKLREQLTSGQATGEAIRTRNDEIEMDCRWQTLHARDRVLAALTDASRLALGKWVESLKAGKTISVPRKDFDRFRLPQ